jgi:hypothetical protein
MQIGDRLQLLWRCTSGERGINRILQLRSEALDQGNGAVNGSSLCRYVGRQLLDFVVHLRHVLLQVLNLFDNVLQSPVDATEDTSES